MLRAVWGKWDHGNPAAVPVAGNAPGPLGVRGLALPGPDGDFVELLAFDVQLQQCLQEHLVADSDSSGVPCRMVSEQQFKSTRWYGADRLEGPL